MLNIYQENLDERELCKGLDLEEILKKYLSVRGIDLIRVRIVIIVQTLLMFH